MTRKDAQTRIGTEVKANGAIWILKGVRFDAQRYRESVKDWVNGSIFANCPTINDFFVADLISTTNPTTNSWVWLNCLKS